MHFLKAVVLFAGIAAAAPTSSAADSKSSSKAVSKASATPAKASATPAKASGSAPAKASGTPSSSGAKAPTTSQVSAIKSDLTNFDTAVVNAISALNGFTGGTSIGDQAGKVTKAGSAWQAATLQLLNDANTLNGYGQFSATDSAAIAKSITGNLGSDTAKLYKLVEDKKSLFAQVNATQSVHDGLVGISLEIQSIGNALTNHFQAADLKSIEPTGSSIGKAATAAIAAYS